MFPLSLGNVTEGGLFPESFIHLGGDEVETGCWSLSPSIKEMISTHNFTSYNDVYLYFVKAIQTMALQKV
jgi:hexosaminidase